MAALARARAAQVEETRTRPPTGQWIKHYVKIGQPEKARELGWDGKPIEAPASAEITSERRQKLQRAASSRMAGLRIVLEDCEDVGNRAAILRTAEAFGLLHIHGIPGAELKTNGRAKKIGVAHSGQKWLRISVHSSAAECVAALRAAGCWRRCRRGRDPAERVVARGARAQPRRRRGRGRRRGAGRRRRARRSSTSISAGTRRSALGTSASAWRRARRRRRRDDDPDVRADREPQRVRRRRARHPLWPRGAREASAPSASTPRAAT